MKCPRCKSRDLVKAGSRVTVKGKKQCHQCNNCGHRFCPEVKK